jgi:23S rRNA pseudouridine2605 synthase
VRINRYIAHYTKYSRREADRLIEDGKVKINRIPITDFSYQVQKDDRVFVNGKEVKSRAEFELTMVVYNKPKGCLVTKKDDRGRTTIYHLLPGKFRHFTAVGRLDYASEGLILLTDNVKVATRLMEDSLPRVYNIKIDKIVSEEMIEAMKNGLTLEDATAGGHEKSKVKSMTFAPFIDFVDRGTTGKFSKLRVTIAEGKNRELRRFFAHFGAEVVDLKRVAYGFIELNNLPEGKTRYLSTKEYEELHLYLKEERDDADS